MDAYDADVLIYAAADDARGHEVRDRLSESGPTPAGLGSVLLISELMIHPTRHNLTEERTRLQRMLSRIVLVPVDDTVAAASVSLGARYGLRTIDALHLASAIVAGADRFVTNNRRDFSRQISEIEIRHPG